MLAGAQSAPRWRRLLSLAAVCTGLFACAGEEVLHLRQATLRSPLAQRGVLVVLPGDFTPHLPRRDSSYELHSRVQLPPAWRGQALGLYIPSFGALVSARVAGQSLHGTWHRSGERYRPRGPHGWVVPAELTRSSEVEVVFQVRHTWTQSGWMWSTPRLTRAVEGDRQTRFAGDFNEWASSAGFWALVTIAFVSVLIFGLERSRKTYCWISVMAIGAAYYCLYLLGVPQLFIGRWEVPVLGMALTAAVMASVWYSSELFALPPPRSSWKVLWLAATACGLLFADPFLATQAYGPVVVLVATVVTVRNIWLFLRLSRLPQPPPATHLNLWGWVSIAGALSCDGAIWIGLPDLSGGLRFGGLPLLVFSLLQFVQLSQSHLRGLREATERQREIEHLNHELRRQIAQRSRQLADALARLAVGGDTQKLAPGQIIDGRYRVERALGAGAMGAVYEVVRLQDERRLALKVLSRVTDTRHLARFAREAQLAAEIRHPNVVSIVDLDFSTSGFMYLVMEYVDGPCLKDCRNRYGDTRWALAVIREMARGISAIHAKGIVHRDLKPANVLLENATGDVPRPRISDFGISGMVEREAAVVPGEPLVMVPAHTDGHASTVVAGGAAPAGGAQVARQQPGLVVSVGRVPEGAGRSLPPAKGLAAASVDALPQSAVVATAAPASGAAAPDAQSPAGASSTLPVPDRVLDEVDAWLRQGGADETRDAPSSSSLSSLLTSRSRMVGSKGGPHAAGSIDSQNVARWLAQSPGLTQTGMLMGTPLYMAPELVQGAQAAGTFSDVFSLGVMAMELLTGELPFAVPACVSVAQGEQVRRSFTLPERKPDVAPEAIVLLERSVSLDPAERPGIDELLRVLDRLL
jgi:serine/threonine protein kinase